MVPVMVGAARKMKQLFPAGLPSKRGYSSAEVCPWPAFEAGLVKKDYSAFASEDQFWDVYTEYVDSLNDGKDTPQGRIVWSIQRLKSRIFRISGMMAIIREMEDTAGVAYIPQLVDELKQDFPRLKFDYPDTYFEDLDRVDALMKADSTRLRALEEDLHKKHSEGKLYTHDYFLNVFAELSKFQGYAIRPEQSTVLDYCVHVRRLNHHNAAQRAEIEKMKHGANRR